MLSWPLESGTPRDFSLYLPDYECFKINDVSREVVLMIRRHTMKSKAESVLDIGSHIPSSV